MSGRKNLNHVRRADKPERYSGWALGVGVERIAQILYQVPDACMFFVNDYRLLKQLR